MDSQQRNKEEAVALAWVRAQASEQTQEASACRRRMGEYESEAAESRKSADRFRDEATEAEEFQSTCRKEMHMLSEEAEASIKTAWDQTRSALATVKELDCRRAAVYFVCDLLHQCQIAAEVAPSHSGPADHTACKEALSVSRHREEVLVEELAAAQQQQTVPSPRPVASPGLAEDVYDREKILMEELAAAGLRQTESEALESAECVRLRAELTEATEQHQLKQRKQKEELDVHLRIVRQEYAAVWQEVAATMRPGCVSVWTCPGWFCVPRCCCRRRDAVAPLPLFDPKLRGD